MSRRQYHPRPRYSGPSSAFHSPTNQHYPHLPFPPEQQCYPQHHQQQFIPNQRFLSQQQLQQQRQRFPAQQQQQLQLQDLQQHQQHRCSLLNEHKRYPGSSPYDPQGQGPNCRGFRFGAGRPAPGSAFAFPASWSSTRAAVVPPCDNQPPSSSATQPPVTYPFPKQSRTPCPVSHGGHLAAGNRERQNVSGFLSSNNNNSIGTNAIGRGRGRNRSCTTGTVPPRPGHFPEQSRDDCQSGVQSTVPRSQDPRTSSSSSSSDQGGGKTFHPALSGTRSLPVQDPEAIRDQSIQQQPLQEVQQQHRQQQRRRKKQSQQKENQRQQGAECETAPQCDATRSSWEATSPRSLEVAESKDKKAESKRANRTADKKISGKDQQKEKQREKMLDHVLHKFPEMHRQLCVVPPVRILEKVKTLEKLKSSHLEERFEDRHKVIKQSNIALDVLRGHQTEDTVTGWLAKIVSSLDGPAFILSNYEFHDYLYYLRLKPKVKQTGKSTTNTNDNQTSESSETKTESFQGADGEPENAKENPAEQENKCIAADSGQATTPAKEPSSASCLFPTPCDLDKKPLRGEFDNLIVIPTHGFIVVETKTMLGKEFSCSFKGRSGAGDPDSDLMAGQSETEAAARHRETQDVDFRNTIKKALIQLQKEEAVLRHLISDLVSNPPVIKVLALPNTSNADLRRLLEDPQLLEECNKTFGTQSLDETLLRCITSELITNFQPQELLAQFEAREATGESLSTEQQWWRDFVEDLARSSRRERVCAVDVCPDGSEEAEGETGAVLPNEIYEEIIARFCGPYSKIPCRTASDCVHLTGLLYGRSVLRTDQLNVLESSEPFLFLTGPPGSGKTLVLGLKAAEWAKQEDQVVVVCCEGVHYGSLVSRTLYDRVVDFMRSLRLRKRKKTNDAAAASAATGGGSGGGNADDAGSTTSKSAKNKASSPKRQVKKRKCPAKQKGQVDRLSSSKCAEGPDKTSTEPETHPQEDASGDEGHHEQFVDGNVEPQNPPDQTRCSDDPDFDDIKVDNVHLAFITLETSIEKFVSDLLNKYGKGNLRIILDESQKKPTETYMQYVLTKAGDHLNKMVEIYEALLDTFRSRMEWLYRNNKIPQEKPRPQTFEEQSQYHKEKAEHKILIEEGNSNKNPHNDGSSKLKFSIVGQKAVNQANEEPQDRQRAAERLQVEEDARAKSVTQGDSNNHTENATSSPSHVSTEMDKEASQKESSASEAMLSSSTQFKADDHITTMEERMMRLEYRFQIVSSVMPSLNADWSETVDGLFETYRTVKNLSGQAAGMIRGTPECCTAEDKGSLDELSKHMVKVMGFMFGVYDKFYAFKYHQFLSALTTARHSRVSARQDASKALSASQQFQSASQAEIELQKQSPTEAESVSQIESAQDTESVSQVTIPSTIENVSRVERVPQTRIVLQAEISPQTEIPPSPPDLSVWVTAAYTNYVPHGFTKVMLTESVRCTPNVQRILMWTKEDNSKYITHACDVNPPLPSDGPPVKWFDHSSHSEAYEEVNDCPECGEALVNYLINTLGLRTTAEAGEKTRGYKGKKKQDEDSQLYFHDVIICGSPIHQPGCTFIQKIRSRGIKVLYECQELKKPPPYTDNILVIGGISVQGLEAKIVVFVPELSRKAEEGKAASRTTSSSTTKEEEEQYSEEDRIVRDNLKRVGDWNRGYVWLAASRSLSHFVTFH